MTPAELQRWSVEYRRRLDHRIRMDNLRQDVAQLQEARTALRRKEEALGLLVLKGRVRRASAAAEWGGKGISVELAQAWSDTQIELAGTTPADEVALVPIWQRDVEQCARVLGVSIEWTATPMNAYSFGLAKRIETSPIVSGTSYASARHELGHQARPCQPAHSRITTDVKLKRSVCVRCELSAWAWAVDGARPQWTRRMHNCLSRALRTYHRYGTASEQRAIDEMTSGIGFRSAQLAHRKRTA